MDEEEEEPVEQVDVDVEVGQSAQQAAEQPKLQLMTLEQLKVIHLLQLKLLSKATASNSGLPDGQLSYNTTDSLGIEIPILREKANGTEETDKNGGNGDDNHGLIVPKIEQADGPIFRQ